MKTPRGKRIAQPTFFKAVLCVAFLCASFLLQFRGGKPRSSERTPLYSAPATFSRLPEVPKNGAQPFGPFPLARQEAPVAAPTIMSKSTVAKAAKPKTQKRMAKKVVAKKTNAALKQLIEVAEATDPAPVVAELLEGAEVDTLLEQTLSEENDGLAALNVVDVVDLHIEEALAEAMPEVETALSGPMSPVVADVMLAIDAQMPREPRLIEMVGTYQKNDFSDIRLSLAALKEQAGVLEKNQSPTVATAMPELVVPKTVSAIAPAKVSDLAQQDLIRATPLQMAVAKGVPDEVAPVRLATPSESAEGDASDTHAQVETSPESDPALAAPAVVAISPVISSGPSLVAPAAKALASIAGSSLVAATSAIASASKATDLPLTTQVSPTIQVPRVASATTTQPKPPLPRMVAQVATPNRSGEGDESQLNRDAEIDGKVYGLLAFEDSVAEFLQRERGHVELSLYPVSGLPSVDTIFVDYHFPAEEFEFDASGMVGEYQLAARIYTPKEKTPYAQVWYPTKISAKTFRDKIRFDIGEKEVRAARANVSVPAGQKLSFRATLFEGAAADHRQAKAIPNGEVRVVGFPEWGSFRSDAEGNLLIPSVPGMSQLILETSATDYYKSFHIVPIYSTPVYAPLYLVNRGKVESITQYFTKNPQVPGQSLVLGRVFDPKTRRPLGGEELKLSFERNRALYFDAFPDQWLPATTGTGLFGFFNIAPSVRFLRRERKNANTLFLNLRPDTAQYVELGRSGKKTLKGRLLDRFQQGEDRPVGFAKVRLIGNDRREVFSNDQGLFDFPDVDFPAGVVTLEIEADGYPRTTQTIAWDPREPELRTNLYLLPNIHVSKTTGSIYGDAREKFYQSKTNCLSVSLFDGNGKLMPQTHGPFPFDTKGYLESKAPYSIERAVVSGPLCLNAARPNYSFLGLPSGEYLLKWHDEKNRTKRTRVIRVSGGRLSVVVN